MVTCLQEKCSKSKVSYHGSLHFSRNGLNRLPSNLATQTLFTSFLLDNNQFTSVPEILQHVKNISLLYLDNNKIEFLPRWLEYCQKLHHFSIKYNPLRCFPVALLSNKSICTELKSSYPALWQEINQHKDILGKVEQCAASISFDPRFLPVNLAQTLHESVSKTLTKEELELDIVKTYIEMLGVNLYLPYIEARRNDIIKVAEAVAGTMRVSKASLQGKPLSTNKVGIPNEIGQYIYSFVTGSPLAPWLDEMIYNSKNPFFKPEEVFKDDPLQQKLFAYLKPIAADVKKQWVKDVGHQVGNGMPVQIQ